MIDIEKMQQAALADTEDEIHWESSTVIELIEQIKALEAKYERLKPRHEAYVKMLGELLAKRNEALGSYRADEYEEAMQELDRHGIPRADGPSDNGLTLSLKGRMLRFLVRMTSNANVTGLAPAQETTK